jgi:outer membrane protein W
MAEFRNRRRGNHDDGPAGTTPAAEPRACSTDSAAEALSVRHQRRRGTTKFSLDDTTVNKKLIFSALVAGAALTSTDLSAQLSKNAGFMLNGHLQGASISVEDDDAEIGFGGGITAGYNFNERLGLYLTLATASIKPDGEEESLGLGQVDLGLRYTFGSTASKLRPYLNAALSGVALVEQDVEREEGEVGDLSLSGGALTLGGGVQYFFSRSLALDVALQGSAGNFSTLSFDGDDVELEGEQFDLTATRLQVGLTWHP